MYLLSIALIHIFVFFLSLNCSVIINNLNNILLFSLPLALSIKEINYNCKNFSYFFLLKYPLSDFTTHHFYFIHFTITFSNHLFIFPVHLMKFLYLNWRLWHSICICIGLSLDSIKFVIGYHFVLIDFNLDILIDKKDLYPP